MAKERPDRFADLTLLRGGDTEYPASPDAARLETFDNLYPGQEYWVTFDCPEFTALCPVTNQPDFGRLRIRYRPAAQCLESKALKLYLFSFRNTGIFHEEAVNRILQDLVRACAPREMVVTGRFRPRGGIRIEVEACFREQE